MRSRSARFRHANAQLVRTQFLSLALKPCSLYAFRVAQNWLAHLMGGLVVWILEERSGLQVIFSGDRDFFKRPGPSKTVLFANHCSYAGVLQPLALLTRCCSDWPALFMLGLRKGHAGSLKIMMKEAVKHVPGLG